MHPTLLHLGRFILPTFGVLAAVGLMCSLSLSLRTARLARLDPDALWNAGLFAILSALALSRLLLVVPNFKSFLSYPLIILALPSLTATGIFLTLIATTVYLRLKGLPMLNTLDAWAPCATLVWAFLALGHLAEGSDPGLITNVPWKILSPTGGSYLHPVALYAAIAAALITVALYRYLSRHPQPGQTLALALAASGVVQFLLTFFRQPAESLEVDSTSVLSLLDPLQWVSLVMVFAAGVILLQATPIAPRTPQPSNPEHHAL